MRRTVSALQGEFHLTEFFLQSLTCKRCNVVLPSQADKGFDRQIFEKQMSVMRGQVIYPVLLLLFVMLLFSYFAVSSDLKLNTSSEGPQVSGAAGADASRRDRALASPQRELELQTDLQQARALLLLVLSWRPCSLQKAPRLLQAGCCKTCCKGITFYSRTMRAC